MELVVLAKAVPRSEELGYDPDTRTAQRVPSELVLNPFDQRALRVGLEQRGAGDHLTVVSLGPPGARPLLREALALGADRALHLCDAAFAGSDLLATATALTAALRPLDLDLVLAGARTTDGDTGLAAIEVAGILGLPVITEARGIRRVVPDGRWEVVRDTETGRETATAVGPLLVTVGEKIAKPLHVEQEAFARQSEDRIETIGPADLGLSVVEVGAFGSPTSVDAVSRVAPRRQGRRFTEGGPNERVREALTALSPRLGAGPIAAAPLPWAPAYDPSREIGVLVTGPDGTPAASSASVVSHLTRALPNFTVSAVGYGSSPSTATEALSAAGARRGYWCRPGPSAFDSHDVARGLGALLDRYPRLPVVVAPPSPFGREVVGLLAGARMLGTVADAIDVSTDATGALSWAKPSFGGSTVAAIRCRSSPTLATMRSAPDRSAVLDRPARTWTWTEVESPAARGTIRRSETVDEPLPGPSPYDASVIVAVGMGVGGPEGIERLWPVVRRWGAALVGTRRVVDAGWLPSRVQVGLTGLQLAPRLAVLLGVRGSPNHTIGWRRAQAVLAVNSDPDAPVFAEADVGIVGTVDEVVPPLVEPLALALGAGVGS